MSEENTPTSGTPGTGESQVQVFLDERELKTVYSNGYRLHSSAEEVIVDFGFNMGNPNPQQGGANQPQVLFKMSDRVIMNYPAAKRLAGSLLQLIKRYEQQFGEIPAQPQPRR